MRQILFSLAIVAAPLGLSACLHHYPRDNADKHWKQDALKECNKEADPMKHQTCMDEIAAVEHERQHAP